MGHDMGYGHGMNHPQNHKQRDIMVVKRNIRETITKLQRNSYDNKETLYDMLKKYF